jgi:hypothetical protein
VGLLDRDDGPVAPTAMLIGELPEGARPAMLTVGDLGERLGVPVAWVPYGRGGIVLAGLPLLAPVGDRPDPRRDRLLARLVREAARLARVGGAPEPVRPVALTPLEAATFGYAADLVGRAVALAERHSALVAAATATGRLPEPVAGALATQQAALDALLAGHHDDARRLLHQAVERVWTPDLQAFLGLERPLLRAMARLVARGGFADYDLAYEVLEAWGQGVLYWFGGDAQTALSWLGTATVRLRDAGELPTDPDEAGL